MKNKTKKIDRQNKTEKYTLKNETKNETQIKISDGKDIGKKNKTEKYSVKNNTKNETQINRYKKGENSTIVNTNTENKEKGKVEDG